MLLFAGVTVSACVLAGLAALFGGVWPWLAALYLTGFVTLMDRLIAHHTANTDPDAEFPAATPLLVTLGLAHFALLGLGTWAVGGPSGLTLLERVLTAIACGLVFGQISHPVAHELIHKPARPLRHLGRWMYTTLLVGHHASAHLLVHHVHVASAADPNSAPRGENFYRFALRVGRQSFLAGLRAENRRRRNTRKPGPHPYITYVGGALGTMAAALLIAGPTGLAALLAMAIYAQLQILMSDYVQHYGLRRRALPNGKPEPVGPQHSWNAPHIFSSALTVNAPRHSDHHITPTRPYPALQLDPDVMPCLPRPLPVMAAIAMVPPLWFRMMNPRCDRWQTVDVTSPQSCATSVEIG
ncbi:MAG: alkane 1-monooxygenase [Roseovarius sp.]